MGARYREVEVSNNAFDSNGKLQENFGWAYIQADFKTGTHLREGMIHKLYIFIEDDETGEIYFNIDQYWIEDEERGVILDDKGERKLFDTPDDAFWHIVRNKSSLIELVLRKMKTTGFNSLTDEEKVMIKEHNKRLKQKK